MIIIVLFILILNIVSILLMYRSLDNMTQKEKLIYIAAGTVMMYLLTLIIYWISTRNIEMTDVSRTGKDLIIFLFVPINGILVLPLFAKSYSKFRDNKLSSRVLRNRGVALCLILFIILIIECVYFENIQKQVENMISEKNNKYYQIQQQALNSIANSTKEESINVNDTKSQSNQIDIETVNEIKSEEVDENNSIAENVAESILENTDNVIVDTLE